MCQACIWAALYERMLLKPFANQCRAYMLDGNCQTRDTLRAAFSFSRPHRTVRLRSAQECMDSSKILSIEGSVNLSMIVAEQLITNCLEWIFRVLNFSAPVRTFIRCPEIDWQSWFEGLPVDHQSAAGEMKTKVGRQQSTSPLASYRNPPGSSRATGRQQRAGCYSRD